MGKTKIEWVKGEDGTEGLSWNALRAERTIERNGALTVVSANHCEHVNEACRFCYSERGNPRLGGLRFKPGHRKDYVFKVNEKRLLDPIRMRRPTRIFVESTSDTFGEWWPREFVDQLYAVMAICSQHHTFINLTKRPDRRRIYLADPEMPARVAKIAGDINERRAGHTRDELTIRDELMCSPLRGVIEGVSVSCQDDADAFVPILLATRAHRRVVSAEPLIGPIDFLRYLNILSQDPLVVGEPSIHWIIAGGESGRSDQNVRPMHPAWPRSIHDQCRTAGIAFHFKQWGEWWPVTTEKAIAGTVTSRAIDAHGDVPPGDPMTEAGETQILNALKSGAYTFMARVGKSAAGRLLDGKEHNGFPVL